MSAAEGVPAPARSPTASAESASEDSSDSEVELADPKESLRWLGYACRVCADAVSRRAPFRRRRVVARPRRAVPTACEKHATRVHARRSCSNPEPPLTPASRAPLHRAHRLVALASGRRPVSDGGFTGVRLPRTRARRARPPAPRPVRRLPRTKENPRRDVFERAVAYVSLANAPIDRTLIHAVTPPRFHRASTRRSIARSWTVSGCAWRLCACSPAAALAAAAKPPTPTPGSGARGAAPWAASAPAQAAPSPQSSASGRRSRRTCRRGGAPRRSTGARRRIQAETRRRLRKGLRRAVSLPSPTPSARRSLRASRRVLSRYGKARSTRR